ncbi:MAG: nitronate monooxygenase [Proteobacteria bacterium]|nr:nitronate monooxygenase [Pseudomonadota bacterium]
MSPTTRAFTDRLGIALPIVQAPMAGFQAGRLAAAAGAAGALASLPGAALDARRLADESALVRAAGVPVNLNFFCHAVPAPDAERQRAWRAVLAPYYAELGVDPATIQEGPGRLPFGDEALDAVLTLAPAVVSFHFGLPAAAIVTRLQQSGAQVWASATTVDEARWLDERGVDAVIAQGLEAGGHRGMFLTDDLTTQLGTYALVPQVVAAVKVPVIAAGGVADAKGVAAALALGAAAVQVGTAFLRCPEATTSGPHRAALASPAAAHTACTNLFSGRPARGIVNRLMRDLGCMRADVPPFPTAVNALAPLRAAAEARGIGDCSPLWSGQNAGGARDVPAADIVRGLAARL